MLPVRRPQFVLTAQAPDQLDNCHPDVEFGPLMLYRVITGDITTNHGWGDPYLFATPPTPPEDRRTISALWRGFIAAYRLGPDGRLTLVSYSYPKSPSFTQGKVETINEVLSGDFWLVMKPAFRAPRTYVPFCNGVVVTDTGQWVLPKTT